jgi:8-oxo-dGTP pyrophosphatase MutT (NUDIX family)
VKNPVGSAAVTEAPDPKHGEQFRQWLASGDGDERPAIPAATVILLRDTPAGVETLMLRRNSKLAFGGMWVFPGGRVDDGDHDETRDAFAAARRAAVREAEEESGLVVAIDDLVPLSHWTPPPVTPKRFSTWFFVAPAPAGAVTIDDGEIHEHMWVSPQGALDQRDDGVIELAPPTWVTLHTLARAADTGDAIARAAAADPPVFVTHIAKAADGLAALWAGDAAYESGEADAPGPRHRLVMTETAWRYERTGLSE